MLGPGNPLFYDEPVHLVRGEGVWLYGADGKQYLDCYNNVPCVGHCHPRVVEALCKQAATLNTHTRYLHENILDYAELLLAKFDDSLDRIAFACTGSEANDLAMRIGRRRVYLHKLHLPWQHGGRRAAKFNLRANRWLRKERKNGAVA